jgi:phosphomevalonate kinase
MADSGRLLAHNLAQYVHCYAQGKVGSGFDVAAAVFGSQLYTRFTPPVLKPLMVDAVPEVGTLGPILAPENKSWDYVVREFRLPPRTRLMLADVDAGSDSPSMAGKVLKWRQENAEEAGALWSALDKANNALAAALLRLSDLAEQNAAQYDKVVKYAASLQPVQVRPNATS